VQEEKIIVENCSEYDNGLVDSFHPSEAGIFAFVDTWNVQWCV
jgi:hypothetical protein